MHKGYFTTLRREFIQGIAGFDPKYLGIYHIVHLAVTSPSVLLYAFWNTLNPALKSFLKNIATKQFFKLLVLLRIIFFQDLVFLCQKYPRYLLFDHFLFFLPEYGVIV